MYIIVSFTVHCFFLLCHVTILTFSCGQGVAWSTDTYGQADPGSFSPYFVLCTYDFHSLFIVSIIFLCRITFFFYGQRVPWSTSSTYMQVDLGSFFFYVFVLCTCKFHSMFFLPLDSLCRTILTSFEDTVFGIHVYSYRFPELVTDRRSNPIFGWRPGF